MDEQVDRGWVVSVELRIGHRLQDIVLNQKHELQILAADGGLLYWITAGKEGTLEITAQVAADDNGWYSKLKANLIDIPYRAYLVQRSLADSRTSLEEIRHSPDIMNTEEAAKYLGISKSTLYKIPKSQIPRTQQKRFRKVDLDSYLEKLKRR